MTVLYSFWLLGERPGAVQWAGIPVAVVGAVLASLVIERGAKVRLVTWGPVFAMIGVLVGSVSNAGLKIPIRDGVDSSLTVITQRVFTVAVVLLVFVFFSRVVEQRRQRGDSRFGGSDPVKITWRTGWLLGLVGGDRRHLLHIVRVWTVVRARLADGDHLPERAGDSRGRRSDVLQRATPQPAVGRRRLGDGRRGNVHRRLGTVPRRRSVRNSRRVFGCREAPTTEQTSRPPGGSALEGRGPPQTLRAEN